jgi:AhpD family alkylhydroperoxidase
MTETGCERATRPSATAARCGRQDVWAGFTELHHAAVADRALPSRIKELMALAIAVVKQCDGCIAYHAKACGVRKLARRVFAHRRPEGAPILSHDR